MRTDELELALLPSQGVEVPRFHELMAELRNSPPSCL